MQIVRLDQMPWEDCVDVDNWPSRGGRIRNGPGPLVHVFSPGGAVLKTWRLPADKPNRCAFGEPDLDTLHVTMATDELLAGKLPPCGGTT